MDKFSQNSEKQLVLASSSASRREQLSRLGLSFLVEAPDIDETPRAAESPSALVRRLSKAKAIAVAQRYPDALIISGDQTAGFAGQFLEKPGTRSKAIEQLSKLQGRQVEFISGLCVLNSATDTAHYQAAHCEVQFRQLSRQQIETYIDFDRPLHCAGSFKCESAGIALFEYIKSSDPSAITGMPLITLVSLLAAHGVQLFSSQQP